MSDFLINNGKLQSALDGNGYGISTTGIVTLGDGSKLTTSAAPTADAQIANKKYVDDNDNMAGSSSFHATKGDQVISTATWTELDWSGTTDNTGSDFSVANDEYVAPATGVYSFSEQVFMQGIDVGDYQGIALKKNDAFFVYGPRFAPGVNENMTATLNVVTPLTASDEIEVWVYHTYGSNRSALGTVEYTYFSGFRVS